MFSSKVLVSMIAAGGLVLASQQVGAAVVASDNVMADSNGLVLNQTDLFDFGGAYAFQGTAASDLNTVAVIGQQLENNGSGFSHSIPIADITAVQPLVNGMTLRMSSWMVSNPLKPWAPLATDGYKIEFWNQALGDFNLNPLGRTNDTEVGFAATGFALVPAAQSLTTTAWQRQTFTVEITDALVDFASLQEIRPVLFEGDFTGVSAGSAGGEMFVDGFTFEVFPDLATANATALPANMPGGFDVPPPPPPVDMSGDLNSDMLVDILDLNIVLADWNKVSPPVAPGPDVISDFSSFNLDGTYVDWVAGATFTSGAADFTVQATSDFGGGFAAIAPAFDATGETTLEIQLDVNAGNVADKFNIVLKDADGTERVFRFDTLTAGAGQTLTVDLINFLQDNQAGTVAGLDLANLTEFHIQGTFENGQPGLGMDLTFDNLALIAGGAVDLGLADVNNDGIVDILDLNFVLSTWNNTTRPPSSTGTSIPEPATLSLLALGGLAMLRRRSA